MPIEVNMHGNPMVIASSYIPHDQTPDIPRQHAWDLLDEIIIQTPIAKNLFFILRLEHLYMPGKKVKKITSGSISLGKECHSSH